MMKEFFEDNKIEVGLAAVALTLSTVFGGDNLGDLMASNTALRESVAAEQAKINKILAQDKSAQELIELANERYDNYCEAVFNLDREGVYTAIIPGNPVIKGDEAHRFRGGDLSELTRNDVLPAGVPVCDAYGNTAIIQEPETIQGMGAPIPVIGPLASTRDKARIERFVQENNGSKQLSAAGE